MSRLLWNLNLDVASGRGRIDCGGDSPGVQAHQRPLRSTENNDGYLAGGKILLIPNILIAGNKDIEPSSFRFGKQVAV